MATTYVDQITGSGETVAYKAPCRLATTGNITLSGLQAIDGIVTALRDRVLVKDQANPADNGIWIAANGAWTRARDLDSNRDITKGTRLTVTDGSTLAGKEYLITSANPIVVGTSNITFAETLSSDAGSSAAAAAASASAASASATAAGSSATAAAGSASSASTSASNAAASAGTASTAATNAGNSATAASGSASAASASAFAAQTAETNAETAEANAEAAQAAAESAASLATKWAGEDEDVEVEPGQYSAKHWAAKAQESAGEVTSVNGQTDDVVLDATDILTDEGGAFDGASVEEVLDDHDGRIVDLEAGAVTGDPYIILATGQSNIALHPSRTWSPPPNLSLWDWDGLVDAPTDVGTAFVPMPGTSIGVAYSYAAEVARDHPSRRVYLVNIGKGAVPISAWKTGATPDDMYAACKANMEAALDGLNVDKIDELLWWQFENDAANNSVTYRADFETVVARFRAEDWFPWATPIVIMGGSVLVGDAIQNFNLVLQDIVATEPDVRTFVNTASLPLSPFWDNSTSYPIHMTAVGYETAGKLAYAAARRGTTSLIVHPWRTIFKPATTTRSSTITVADDPHLRTNLKANKTYVVRGRLIISSGATADFKWGIKAPANLVAYGTSSYIASDAATTVVPLLAGGLPTNRTVLMSGSNFAILQFEVLILITSADGELAVQWAQNTSNAESTMVACGSYIEVMGQDYA